MTTSSSTYGAGDTTRSNGGAAIIRDINHVAEGPGPDVMDAATLNGDSVVNAAGDDLGKIEAIMLDVASGRIAYAVLSFGGFMGFGDKLFAVPWPAFTMDAHEKHFVLDATRERLEAAPGFDKDHWPAMADRAWATAVHAYYNVAPYWNTVEPMGDMHSAKVDELPPAD